MLGVEIRPYPSASSTASKSFCHTVPINLLLFDQALTDTPPEVAKIQIDLLRQVPLYLDEQEVLVHDAGVGIADMHEAGIARFVIRLAVNCTGRRNHLPATKKRGRPTEYGQLIRPLPRKRGNKHIPATARYATVSSAGKIWANKTA